MVRLSMEGYKYMYVLLFLLLQNHYHFCTFVFVAKCYYRPPEGGPLIDIYLDIVSAFLWDSFFLYRINIMLIL